MFILGIVLAGGWLGVSRSVMLQGLPAVADGAVLETAEQGAGNGQGFGRKWKTRIMQMTESVSNGRQG